MTWKYLRDCLAANTMTYAEYLASGHWKSLRERFWASRLHRRCCYACGASAVPLEVHHKSYRRIGNEKLADLCLLCRGRHGETHELDRARGKGCLWGAAKRLRKNKKAAR